jgi:hypothetical protein
MIISEQDQDIVLRDSSEQKPDTSFQQIIPKTDTVKISDSLPVRKILVPKTFKAEPPAPDTTSVCERNIIADVTFSDPANLVNRIERHYTNGFPWKFLEINRERELTEKQAILGHLKGGKEIPARYFHDDWIVILILACAFIYTLIRTTSRKLFPEMTRFFLFRGINDPASRDIQGLFHWQSTLLNLISFFNIALFSYCTASYFEFIPDRVSGILIWLIAVGLIVAAISARHALCAITGNISDEKDAFREYIITVYHSYRYIGIILFTLVIFISFSKLFPEKLLFFTGFIAAGVFYLVRVMRLFMIFIKRNISILYLILYLCALEFLPVMILLKYFTGLF